MNFGIKGLKDIRYNAADILCASSIKEEEVSNIVPKAVNRPAKEGFISAEINKMNIPVQNQNNANSYGKSSIKDTIKFLQNKFGIIE